MKLVIPLFLLTLLLSAPVLAEEKNAGFGDYFAQTEHPGFQDPLDAEAVADIEPAAGETEEDKETATENVQKEAPKEPPTRKLE